MKKTVLKILTWLGAIALGRLMGINALVPALTGFLAYFLIKKSNHETSIRFKYPLSILIGHTSWMIFGYVYLVNLSPSSLPDFFLIDVAISVTFVLLLVMVTKKWVYISLYLYEIMSILINLEALTNASTSQASAILTHVVIRIAVIVTLFLALKNRDSENEGNSNS